MSKLENIIKQASQKYYSDGSSEYTDTEFDKMLEDLKKENPDSKLLTDVGHGYDINKDSTYGVRRKHKYGDIIGLEKCHNWKELRSDFKDEKSVFFITPKIDGMSIVCYFKAGKLDMALTRGSRDGDTGIDVTDKVKYISEFHNMFHFTYRFTGAIRGEIVMSQEKFEDITKKYPQGFDGKKPFSNPRNTTAGIMNRKDYDKHDLEYLDILFYYVVGAENDEYFSSMNDSTCSSTYEHVMTWLYEEVRTSNIVPTHVTRLYEDKFEETMTDARRILNLASFGVEEFPTDGLVINKSVQYHKSTGEIVYDAQAFKFPAESCKTEVTDVIWNLSKTHYLIPIVQVEPVQLSGATVTYATGFNADWIQMHKVSEGSIVTLTRSGEVIPYILDVQSKEDRYSYVPSSCPECGHKLELEGVHLICTNEQCPNALKQDVMEWVNHLVPMDNFGDKLRYMYLSEMLGQEFTVEYLMKKLRDGYTVVGSSIQDNMFKEFLSRLQHDEFSLQQSLEALNVPRLGEVTSRKLSMHQDIVDYIIAEGHFPMEDIEKIVGQATATSILQNRWKFKRLKFIRDRIKSNDVEFKGKVAITGKLSVKRKDFEEELKQYGYFASNISKDCKFLITDDPNSSSSKNVQATKWGIQKITEEEFRQKYFN